MSRRRSGLLVALEGIDGVGKSTLAGALLRTATRRGVRAVARREPTDRTLGHLAQEASLRDPWTGAVYFTVDRFLARPALEKELARYPLVITDRSFYSTLAYQGSALGRSLVRELGELSRRATRTPDVVILLDLDPVEALRRLGLRGRGRGPLERRRTLERVARAYRALARRHGWLVLDARRPRRELADATWAALAPRLPRARRGGRRPRAEERT